NCGMPLCHRAKRRSGMIAQESRAQQVGQGRLAKTSLGLYALPRRIDFAGTCLGATAQILRHVAEAIGMVLADQLAVGALDGALVGIARYAQHRVRIGTIVARRRPVALLLGPGAGV